MYTHPQCTTVPGNILTDKYPLQHGLLFSNNYLVSSTRCAHMCAYELQRPGRKGAAITDDSRAPALHGRAIWARWPPSNLIKNKIRHDQADWSVPSKILWKALQSSLGNPEKFLGTDWNTFNTIAPEGNIPTLWKLHKSALLSTGNYNIAAHFSRHWLAPFKNFKRRKTK